MVADLNQFYSEYDRIQKSCSDEELGEWLSAQCETARTEHPDDPRMIGSMYNELGSYYKHRGRLKEGEEAFLQAKMLWEPFEKDANYATIINNLAGNYRLSGNFSEAISLFQQAIEIYQNDPKTPKSIVSSAYNNLALVYLDTGRFSDAAELLQSASEILKDEPDCFYEKATTYANMAIAYYKNGDADLADEKIRLADGLYQSWGMENTPEYQGFLKLKEVLMKK